ncbi:NUDIX hydrolase N-terminal domain-containing protein [Bradyrhizobium sp. 188]|uniref:NUDIX hydrolase N-terminal domain-containing protein n=1 Tax=Bradyrhizobium sp. 188 TaxID=2782656 RepID=UPI001FF80492|nr:NUDIX hydrolase N-terminal domain-containing protein [Bradyrhizobium sp. 188]
MEPQWLTYGKRLQAIASSGLHFARDQFDRERYEEIASIANEMLANLGSVPIERIEGLISDFAKGYATPKVDVRGAIVEENKVLLVREKSDVFGPCLAALQTLAFLLPKISQRSCTKRLN